MLLMNQQADRRAETRALNTLHGHVADVLQVAVDTESGIRGYAATGDATMDIDFDAVADRIGDELRGATEVATSPDQDAISEIRQQAASVLAELETVHKVIAAGSPSTTDLTSSLRDATTAMTSLRSMIATFEGDVEEQIADGRSDIENLQQHQLVVRLISLVLGGLAAIAGVSLFTSGIVRRITWVTDNARTVSKGGAIQASVGSRDEIGVMVDDLTTTSALLSRQHVELAASRDQAIEATRAKDEFLSRVSHELRTPLTAILGFGALLQLEDLRDDDRTSVDHIVKAGRHLHDLINDLIDISQVESGNLSVSVEPVHVYEVIDETLALLGPMSADNAVTLRAVEATSDISVLADRQRLKQVLLNLVSNAIKYNRRGGTVDVFVTVTNDSCARVCVSDTGFGLTEESLAKLFRPFERLGASRSGIEGTGVGLALSKSLVEAMSGSIGADSVKDVGSTFWFALPTAETRPAVEPPARRTTAAPPTWSSTVLYVEDNPASVKVVEAVFASRPEHLEVVGQGAMVVDLAVALRPALILLDQHLPDISGEDVLLRLKADPRTCDIPVVIITAEVSATRSRRMRELGAIDQLDKPLDVAHLIELLDAAR